MAWTRRDFITRVAATGGNAYAAMCALDILAPARAAGIALAARGDGMKVVILGAGVAGLCAAYELGKAGYDCRILEARMRPGGRVWTARGGTIETELGGQAQTATFSDGLYFNPGPARVSQHHVTMDYYRALGVAIEPFINVNLNAYYHTAHPQSGLSRVRAARSQADVRGHVSELLAKAVTHDALDAPMTRDDREKLVSYLRKAGDLDKQLRYAGSPSAGWRVMPGAGNTAGTKLDPLDLNTLVAAGFGGYALFADEFDQEPQMFTPVGGIDALPRAFARRLGDRITYGAHVTHIGKRPGGARITYRERSGAMRAVDADYCICAIPLPVLHAIPSDLSPAHKRAIGNVAYASAAKTGLEFKRRFWEEDDRIFGGISWTDQLITQVWYPSNGYFGSRGVLTGLYNFESNAATFGKLGLAERERLVLEQGAKIHPQYPAAFASAFSVAWQHVAYSQGGWAAYTEATRARDYPVLDTPDGRIYLAGEHMSYINGWQAGALESARLVVSRISAHVAGREQT